METINYSIGRQELEDIITASRASGHQMAVSVLIPETETMREKEVILFIKLYGYKQKELARWIDLGWIKPRKHGKRSATDYSRQEVVDAVLRDRVSKVIKLV